MVTRYPSSCGIFGMLRTPGASRIKGSWVRDAICAVRFRGIGLGAGYAVLNEEGGPYRLGLFAVKDYVNYVLELTREQLRAGGFEVVDVSVRNDHGRVLDLEIQLGNYHGDAWGVINDINSLLWESGGIGRVYYWGRHVRVFKGVGHPEEVAEVYGIDELDGDLWLAHTRFPTNSPGYLPYWSHPFSVEDMAIIHNGELSSYGANVNYLVNAGVKGFVGTDSEVVAYLLHYLVRMHGLDLETAVKVMVNPSQRYIEDKELSAILHRYRWARLDGPFTVALGLEYNGDIYLVAFADRFKLRPVVVGFDGEYYYVASEEAQIRAVSPRARVWTLEPGGYFIASMRRGLVSWGRRREDVELFFRARDYAIPILDGAIDARGLDYKELNTRILERILRGERRVRVVNVNGQRFIGVNLPRYGIRDVVLEIYGTPGNCLGNLNNGVDFVVYGNAQDDVGDTMHGGSIVIHGDARDVLGQAFQGGYILVRGNAGNRVGIQMREYVNKRPYLIIGGRVDDYLGEYMAGGVIMVLGIDALDRDVELTGRYVGSGMVGGRIYVRGRLPRSKIGLQPSKREVQVLIEALKEEGRDDVDDWFRRIFHVGHAPRPSAEYRELTEEEARELKPVIVRYINEFNLGIEPEEILGLRYTVVRPGLKEELFEGIID